MNCCTYKCNQGQDCPARSKKTPNEAHGCAKECGNVWFARHEKQSDWKSVGAYVLVTLFTALNFAVIAGVIDYFSGR